MYTRESSMKIVETYCRNTVNCNKFTINRKSAKVDIDEALR